MATGQTPTYLLPYPLSTDPVDVHGDIFELSDRLEDVIGGILPSQAGNTGKYLTTNGSSLSWTTVDALPSQSGNNGKYLTTNGSAASWATIISPSAATPLAIGLVYGYTPDGFPSTVSLGRYTGSSAINQATLVGNFAGYLATGEYTTAIGYSSAYKGSGAKNTIVGALAGNGDIGVGSTGSSNVFVGYSSGRIHTTGSYNVLVGSIDSNTPGITEMTSGSNNVLIGGNALPSSASASNEITLGNSSVNKFRIPGMEIDWQYVISEETTIFASAPIYYTNYDVMTSRNICFYTSNTTNHWEINIRGDASTTYNNISSIGKSNTFVVMATNGGAAFYSSVLTIDGTPQTVKWQGGSAPSAGNTSSIDVYTYTIIKTAANTYTVLGSQTKFA